jgi:hypothetical protein
VTLLLRPCRFRLVEHRHVRHVVQPQQRDPPRPPRVERGRDDDAAKPREKRRRLVEIAQAPERDEIRLLHRVLRQHGVAQHAHGDGIRHRLRGPDEAAERLEVPFAGANDERV